MDRGDTGGFGYHTCTHILCVRSFLPSKTVKRLLKGGGWGDWGWGFGGGFAVADPGGGGGGPGGPDPPFWATM